ncbi:winged helix-turn-helix domain-containing protein [Streptomyces sp. NPDC088354]|uniref:winged helix-turn-helix domain-containing protein n=1 Tax=unclassified Streptomyces TaxID=2593676 RepID=UPI0029BC024A|nr:winged helix-turn-helix domain-containing protein [Streptomyces sp. MI02-7b]MDX3076501.1 winged helix-turn-helix domain-containing protein [Streptomyces sp. MI02-7b]
MNGSRGNGGVRREWERVADSLRHQIEAGEIPVDEQLPTQAELVETFDVARATVQRALKELQDEGYVESIQGKGVFARNWRNPTPAHANGAAHRTDSASVELEDAIAEAFEAEHITIDAYCLTSESLNAALSRPVGRILRGELRPSSIAVRLLLPSPDALLAIPRNVEDPDDARPRHRLAGLIDLQTRVLRNLLGDLENRELTSVKIETKTVPITPMTKIYLLNGDQGLTGYYSVVDNNVVLDDGTRVAIYDVLGVGAELYPQGPAQLEECRQWFDSLWTTIAESV